MSRKKIRETIEALADVRNKEKYIHIWINFVLIEKTENLYVKVSYNNKTDDYTLFLINREDYSIPITAMEHMITSIAFEVVR